MKNKNRSIYPFQKQHKQHKQQKQTGKQQREKERKREKKKKKKKNKKKTKKKKKKKKEKRKANEISQNWVPFWTVLQKPHNSWLDMEFGLYLNSFICWFYFTWSFIISSFISFLVF